MEIETRELATRLIRLALPPKATGRLIVKIHDGLVEEIEASQRHPAANLWHFDDKSRSIQRLMHDPAISSTGPTSSPAGCCSGSPHKGDLVNVWRHLVWEVECVSPS